MLLLREAVMSAARAAAADEKGRLSLIPEKVQLRFATRKQALVLILLIVNLVPISDHALTREAAAPLLLLVIHVRVAVPRGMRRM